MSALQDRQWREWWRGGDLFIWLNAAAVALCLLAVLGVILLLLVRGSAHFWPARVMAADYAVPLAPPEHVAGQVRARETVPLEQLTGSGVAFSGSVDQVERILLQVGHREQNGEDFRWLVAPWMRQVEYPTSLVLVERREWGTLYGYLRGLNTASARLSAADGPEAAAALWDEFQQRIARARAIDARIETLKLDEINDLNYRLEQLERRRSAISAAGLEDRERARLEAEFAAQQSHLTAAYDALQQRLDGYYREMGEDTYELRLANGETITQPVADVVRAYQPNALDTIGRLAVAGDRLWEFLSAQPREANTEGGVFPAIFGTVLMVLLMTVLVTPLGILAAVYLREYATQGLLTQTIRIAVNNLAGVPSIVYGLFGLGFFVYAVGGSIDQLFYSETLPAPTFGTPGIFWAALTLALLTLPVVIVATEEGLARLPRSLREASFALGATRLQTVFWVVLPAASPALMTGMILAIARAAGEVAPLMLVGVVKLAPVLPVDGNFPYLHLERQFMHLGFHIYDVGLQSPNVEAARPLVYATALLLVVVIVALNLSAIRIRNRLREQYKSNDV